MVTLRRIHRTDPDALSAARINDEAFPPAEHLEMEEMFGLADKADSAVYGIYAENLLKGFAWLIANTRCVYIFFLAIDSSCRGEGYGSQALRELFRMFPDRQVVLDFEEIDPLADNYAQRVRRRDFYLRCGFHETGRYTMLRGDRFEVVCSDEQLDADAFYELVLEIHRLLPEFSGVLI